MSKGDCKICASAPDVLVAINNAIRSREKFRDLAARTGFDKSTLHRHSQKCIPREILNTHKNVGYYNSRMHRLFIQWPDSHAVLVADVEHGWSHERKVRPEEITDFVIEVEFEKPLAPRIAAKPVEEIAKEIPAAN
jgi:hypothetical protein